MLSRYYGFREDPFGASPDSRCLYQSSTHCEALASLKYAYSSNRGFIALIASPGMGKTTLLFRFLEEIRHSARTAFIFDIDPQCEPREIVSFILRDIGIVPGRDHAEMHEQLHLAVLAEAKAGRRFVVVIDEAQNLSDAALEVVRMLSNFETSRSKLMQVVLAGQPQLADTLMKPSLLQLRQRISTFCRIERLSVEQTKGYIDHRLKFVGYEGPPLFTAEAISQLTAASHGIPRNINNLCFNALSLCCAMGRKQVDGAMVAEVIADQQLIPEPTDAPATLPGPTLAAIDEAEIVPFYRPAPRSGGTKRTWPWVISAAGILVATVLGVFGVSELRLHRSHQNAYVKAADTTAKSTTPAVTSWQSSSADTTAETPVGRSHEPVQPVLPAQLAKQVTHRNLPNADAKPLHHVEAPQVLADSTLSDIRARLVGLRRQLSDLKATLTPGDYKVQRLQSQIEDLEHQSADRRARMSKRSGVQNPEASLRKQLVTQAYSQPQEIVNPATAHANLIPPGQTMRSPGPRATPVLLPAASRAKAEAVDPKIPTLNAPARLAVPSQPAANSFAAPASAGTVAPGSKE
jgi:type II secretory pathway predicted ATPase ExeA